MYNIEDAKIIGITGQVGKTSTAILLHEYLKSIGKKSIIYSSGLIDSPANANIKTNNCLQTLTFGSEHQIANILNEAIAYEAEYIIIEC